MSINVEALRIVLGVLSGFGCFFLLLATFFPAVRKFLNSFAKDGVTFESPTAYFLFAAFWGVVFYFTQPWF